MHNVTQKLKAELWQRFGDSKYPAEWDGNIYGGGKLSQRFWEYFKAIELLELDENSVVLDIGGGSPITKAGFFASLLSTAVKTVIIMDPNIADNVGTSSNIQFISKDSDYDGLCKLLIERPEITHIASVSVFEHIPPDIREGMVRAIDENFAGNCFVGTFEYHAKKTFFEYQLTAGTASKLFGGFSNYYLDEMEASPVWCENAYDGIKRNKHKNKVIWLIQKIFFKAFEDTIGKIYVPYWYPVAVRFIKSNI